MIFIKKIFLFFRRELKLFYTNIVDLFSNILFFFLSIFIFVFALGTDEQLLRTIGLGIIWSLLLLSSTLSLRKFYEEDFNNGVLIIIHMRGMSYELIVLLKILMLMLLDYCSEYRGYRTPFNNKRPWVFRVNEGVSE